LNWETAVELENLGFNILRSNCATGAMVRLNSELISGIGSGTGSAYEWLDASAKPGKTYFYWLEDVSWDFDVKQHGPAIRWGTADGTNRFVQVAAFATFGTGGLYRISYATLQKAGVPVESIDPSTISLMAMGSEIPIFVVSDGVVLQPGDYLLFYAPKSPTQLSFDIVLRPDAARMTPMWAAPTRAVGDVLVGVAGPSQEVYFDTATNYARYMMINFTGIPVWMLDVTEATNSMLMYGYSYVSGTNGLTAVYMSYAPVKPPAHCLAVQDGGVIEVESVTTE
jgi:hypothetical protein